MLIKSLKLTQFRNYKSLSVEFSNHINVFYGENAQGKTNLIESIYFLSLLKSFRNHSIKDLFFFDSDYFRINASIKKNNIAETLSVAYDKGERRLSLNQIEIKKTNEYIGYINVISFTPDDLNLIKGFPSERRRLMDIEISKVSPIYLYSLAKYQYLLKQRNTMLKQQKTKNMVYIDILNDQMATLQIDIIKKRTHFINQLKKYATHYYQIISGNKEALSIDYKICLKDLTISKESIIDKYKETLKRDMHLKSTSFGIHREDIVFLINDKNAEDFASQGQQRSIVLAIKLALINYIFNEINDYPILLLDDVLSELDENRKAFLFSLIDQNIQTFITTTSIDGIKGLCNREVKLFKVEDGAIVSLEEDVHGR